MSEAVKRISPAVDIVAAATDMVRQAFATHRLESDATCSSRDLLLGDLYLVSAARLVTSLGRADIENAFAEAAMSAALPAPYAPQLQRAAALAQGPEVPSRRAGTAEEAVAPGDEATYLERRLRETLADDPAGVAEPMSQLIEAGGKRLRPILAFLTSSLGPTHRAYSAATLACVFEFIHDAALIHDDVVDQSPMRRGRPSVQAAHGLAVAVRVGDYYFARAAELLAALESPAVTAVAIDAVERVCQAQLSEYQGRGNEALDEKQYLATVEGKTAALFAGACAAGATLGGCDTSTVRRMADFGRDLGVAFQIADDVVDFSPRSGKPLLQDLRQSVMSLPLLYAFREPASAERLSALAENDGAASAAEAARIVAQSGALDAARARAREYRDRALQELEGLPRSRVRERLAVIAGQAVEREA
jgi:geranylgeranyl pyrophosphate synthase